MFSRCIQLQRLNPGSKTIDMMGKRRNVATHFSVPPISMKWVFESIKRPYDLKIKLLEGIIEEQKAHIERPKKDLLKPYEDKIKLLEGIIEDTKADIEEQKKDLMKPYEDKIKLLQGIIEDRRAELKQQRMSCDISETLHEVDQFEIADLKYKYLRDTGKLNPYHVLEFISNSIPSMGFNEKVQSKLDRITESGTFRSALKGLCAELMISESQVEQSRQEIFEWFWKHEHAYPWEHSMKIKTDNTNYPTSIAVSYLAYLRWSKIKHSYNIRGQVIDWPVFPLF